LKSYITDKVLYILGGICFALVAIDFLRDRHGVFDVEHWPLFFCLFGFIIYWLLIIAAKQLRKLIERPENYYGDEAIDAEDEPGLGPDAPEKQEVVHD